MKKYPKRSVWHQPSSGFQLGQQVSMSPPEIYKTLHLTRFPNLHILPPDTPASSSVPRPRSQLPSTLGPISINNPLHASHFALFPSLWSGTRASTEPGDQFSRSHQAQLGFGIALFLSLTLFTKTQRSGPKAEAQTH